MAKHFTVQDFFNRFPTDDSCLDHLMTLRFGEAMDCPKCGKHGRYSRISKVPAYQCSWCANRIHPMVGTPFEKSSTPLQKWFYAMYLFTTSRHGVPAKELQRQLGVTYKTAWRMGHEIRKYMAGVDGDDGLSGHVEADETYIGGVKPGKRGRGAAGKTAIFGMVERDGDVLAKVVPNTRRPVLEALIDEHVEKGSTISTDEYSVYQNLDRRGYEHGSCNHSAEQYVNGVHHTNTMEGFWCRLKLSIKGTHVHVSPKHLQKYLGEFEYRFNMRKSPEVMFSQLIQSF